MLNMILLPTGCGNMDFNVGRRLHEIRKRRGLTQRQLAERAGIAHSLISLIEKNHHSPSVASLRKVLGGFPMTLGEFFNPEQSPVDRVFFRAEELTELAAPLGNGTKGQISLRQVGDPQQHNLQILHEHYEPGADTGEEMLEHDSREGGVVVRGEIELTVGTQTRTLRAGDAYLFDSRLPHRFRNAGSGICEIISACTPPYA
jgi:transcriptional regulator with XRE-family HTH domain